MDQTPTITVNSESEIWNQIAETATTGLHNFHTVIQLDNRTIELDIASSPGGGEEGGYSSTSIRTRLPEHTSFVFVIYPEDFLNRIGKLFGMEDIVLGYPEFDSTVIVKTNDSEKLKNLFASPEVREVFQSLSGFSLKIDEAEHHTVQYLDLTIQRALADVTELRRVFNAYYQVLVSL